MNRKTRKAATPPKQLKEAPKRVIDAYNRLTPLRKAFALARPLAKSDVEAAVTAGYAEQTAKKVGFQTAALPDVKVVVQYLLESTAQVVVTQAKDSVERQLEELCRIGLVDPRLMFDDLGNLLPVKEWPEDVARAVSSIESFEEYEGRGEDRKAVGMVRKIKFHGKIEAIDKVLKVKGGYRPEQHEHTHRVQGLGDLLNEIDGAGTGPGPSS